MPGTGILHKPYGKDNGLKGFRIAGKDSVFYEVPAVINGDKVLTSGSAPRLIRYGWENDPECNLFNKRC